MTEKRKKRIATTLFAIGIASVAASIFRAIRFPMLFVFGVTMLVAGGWI